MTASCLYIGEVTHRRMRPKEHALRYRLFQTFLDLDEAQALSDANLVFGFNRPSLLSFYERDHGDGSKTPLKAQVEARVRAAGYATGGPVRVLCLPRVLGFVFNPISVYFCHGPHWALTAIVYEVNNTFGDRICYVLPADGGTAVIEHGTPKAMHVSPFMDMEHDYDFLLNEPGDQFSMAIHVRSGDQLWLTAGFSGERRPFTDPALLAAWARHPLLTLKVVAGIHWEAWKSGARAWRTGPSHTGRCGGSRWRNKRSNRRRRTTLKASWLPS
jgi:DUF1365 family protein